jgi:hypothetical protein
MEKFNYWGEVTATGSVFTAEEMGEVCHSVHMENDNWNGAKLRNRDIQDRDTTTREGGNCGRSPTTLQIRCQISNPAGRITFRGMAKAVKRPTKGSKREVFTLETFKRQLDVFLGIIPDRPPVQHYQRREASNNIVHQVAQMRADER